MTDKNIDKIPITVEVPKADVWVRNDYRDIVRRLGPVHMIRACEHQHDDDFVPLYDIETLAGYQIELEKSRERSKRQAKRLWYIEHLLRSAYPYVPGDTAWDFNCGGYLQDLIDQALGDVYAE